MNIFSLFVDISFFLIIIRSLFFWVSLWQDKEYRLDRLFVHFRETLQGKQIFFSMINGVKWFFFFFYGFIVFYEKYATFYEIALGVFFLIRGVIVFKDAYQRRVKRPVFTVKAIAIIALSLAVLIILFIFSVIISFVWLILIEIVLPFVVALFVFFFAFPTEIFQDIRISQARKKLEKRSDILVIGVSGSYGKTSTKEYIAQILSEKFTVAKTPGSNNTPFGIASAILKQIKKETKIFVVEMGAYKKGEIAELTKIVKPNISVTTAISDQHISLYGSMQNVIESEYELIKALPKSAISLFNGNSKNIKNLYERTKTEKIIYKSFNQKPKQNMTIGAYNVNTTLDKVKFTVIMKNKEFNCSSSLHGVHIVENILPAIYLADYLGFSTSEIIKSVAKLKPPPQTMVKRKLRNGAYGMDDTFNVSPESVTSAMDFLSLCKGKKIFVLAPLTELGKEAGYRHYLIGKKAGSACDYLFLLNKNFYKELSGGIADSRGNCLLEILRPEKIARIISKTAKKGDMIIFEGKESKMVLKKLL